eukprot:XP_001609390.1 hypothetical protein [Babesia bovis T2Bo]
MATSEKGHITKVRYDTLNIDTSVLRARGVFFSCIELFVRGEEKYMRITVARKGVGPKYKTIVYDVSMSVMRKESISNLRSFIDGTINLDVDITEGAKNHPILKFKHRRAFTCDVIHISVYVTSLLVKGKVIRAYTHFDHRLGKIKFRKLGKLTFGYDVQLDSIAREAWLIKKDDLFSLQLDDIAQWRFFPPHNYIKADNIYNLNTSESSFASTSNASTQNNIPSSYSNCPLKPGSILGILVPKVLIGKVPFEAYGIGDITDNSVTYYVEKLHRLIMMNSEQPSYGPLNVDMILRECKLEHIIISRQTYDHGNEANIISTDRNQLTMQNISGSNEDNVGEISELENKADIDTHKDKPDVSSIEAEMFAENLIDKSTLEELDITDVLPFDMDIYLNPSDNIDDLSTNTKEAYMEGEEILNSINIIPMLPVQDQSDINGKSAYGNIYNIKNPLSETSVQCGIESKYEDNGIHETNMNLPLDRSNESGAMSYHQHQVNDLKTTNDDTYVNQLLEINRYIDEFIQSGNSDGENDNMVNTPNANMDLITQRKKELMPYEKTTFHNVPNDCNYITKSINFSNSTVATESHSECTTSPSGINDVLDKSSERHTHQSNSDPVTSNDASLDKTNKSTESVKSYGGTNQNVMTEQMDSHKPCGERSNTNNVDHSLTWKASEQKVNDAPLRCVAVAKSLFHVGPPSGSNIVLLLAISKRNSTFEPSSAVIVKSECNIMNNYTSLHVQEDKVRNCKIIGAKDIRMQKGYIFCKHKNVISTEVESFQSTVGLWHYLLVHTMSILEDGVSRRTQQLYQEIINDGKIAYRSVLDTDEELLSFIYSMRPQLHTTDHVIS